MNILQLAANIIFWAIMRALPARATARHMTGRSVHFPTNLTQALQTFDESESYALFSSIFGLKAFEEKVEKSVDPKLFGSEVIDLGPTYDFLTNDNNTYQFTAILIFQVKFEIE